jgi:hypothetical protein
VGELQRLQAGGKARLQISTHGLYASMLFFCKVVTWHRTMWSNLRYAIEQVAGQLAAAWQGGKHMRREPGGARRVLITNCRFEINWFT